MRVNYICELHACCSLHLASHCTHCHTNLAFEAMPSRRCRRCRPVPIRAVLRHVMHMICAEMRGKSLRGRRAVIVYWRAHKPHLLHATLNEWPWLRELVSPTTCTPAVIPLPDTRPRRLHGHRCVKIMLGMTCDDMACK